MTGRAIAITTITVIGTGGDTTATDGIVIIDIGIAVTGITDPGQEGSALPAVFRLQDEPSPSGAAAAASATRNVK